MSGQPFRADVVDRVADQNLENVTSSKFLAKGIAAGLATTSAACARYETIDAAAAAAIPANVNSVLIDGRRTTTGVLTPAMWTARADEPAHLGKFQNALDYRWFEIAEYEIRPEMCTSAALGGSGNEAANMAAFAMAISAIKGRGYGALRLGRQYATNAPVTWSGNNIRVVTDHPGCGLFMNHTGNAWEVGAKTSLGGARSNQIHFDPMTITQNAAGSTGAGIIVWNAINITLDHFYSTCFKGIVLGEDVSGGPGNDVQNVVLIKPYVSGAGGGAIHLLNGSKLDWFGGMLNGNGSSGVPALTIGGTYHNWDGWTIVGGTWEQWALGGISRGAGCANGNVDQLQQDRATEFGWDLSPASGGLCHKITIQGSHIYNTESYPSANASIGIRAGTTNGGAALGIDVTNNRLAGFGKQAVQMIGVTDATVNANRIMGAGGNSSGTYASVDLDTCDGYNVGNNHIRSASHKYGIKRTGSTNGKNTTDLASYNNVIGAITAATV